VLLLSGAYYLQYGGLAGMVYAAAARTTALVG